MINVFQPSLGAEELAAVDAVFRSSWVGRGQITERFETEFAAHLGLPSELVQSVSSCTEGLFHAMALLDLGPGDEVVLPAVSFVGAANAIAERGARPVFCDVETRSLNATARLLEERLTPRTKAVIVQHFGGVPCRLDEIVPLLEKRGIALVEDSACSVTGRLGGRACGTFGDIGVWSFDAMKQLVTGDGGMIYCRDADGAERLGRRLYLGLQEPSGLTSTRRSRWWEFDVSSFGRRAVMNDMTAAIGRVQLRRLPSFVERRRRLSAQYDRELSGIDWLATPPALAEDAVSSACFYWVQTAPETRDALAGHLRERGIYTTFKYHPLHRVPLYGHSGALPGTERAADRTLLLPLHQALADDDVACVVEAIREFTPPSPAAR